MKNGIFICIRFSRKVRTSLGIRIFFEKWQTCKQNVEFLPKKWAVNVKEIAKLTENPT